MINDIVNMPIDLGKPIQCWWEDHNPETLRGASEYPHHLSPAAAASSVPAPETNQHTARCNAWLQAPQRFMDEDVFSDCFAR